MSTWQKGDIMYSPTKRTLNNKTSGSKIASGSNGNGNGSGNGSGSAYHDPGSSYSSPQKSNKMVFQEQPMLVRNMYDQNYYYYDGQGYGSPPMSNRNAMANPVSPFLYSPVMLPNNVHASPTTGRKKKVSLNRNPRNSNLVMPSSPIKNNNIDTGSKTANLSGPGKKYKELRDIDDLPRSPCNYETPNLKNRYFGPVQKVEDNTDRKANVNISYKNSKSKQKKPPVVYKLATPLASKDVNALDNSFLLQPDTPRYYKIQPIKFLHSEPIENFAGLQDISTHLLDNNTPKKKSHISRVQPPPAATNDSFDLSFDGKALDRSDIFRMVDSFSIAFSDDEDNEESSFISRRNNNDILPADMTNNR
ncbi:Uncharacterized protein AO441_000174 [Nakaseomyces glabratus]|uniref:Uncharacterized protein n=1 Tax=Candida glabrata TaxID=5478 RepID=A0A0W0CV81_CANGB|nr:hypothetical protein J7298_00307 [Nakaseomyces glabratus]KAH7591634.1 hypothetical protein J7297_00310 [Nakaseomyces glabratus]KAH7598229.1 hypothetical protein J7296_00309 [Nakaseomyces glabratus]KAH7608859.1 hypothetical protein J7295_00313 [Nakaseomyces glabratus]KAH7615226.1 hypothetical protein J7292_00309 [Nakaseomyces glabratus]